MDERARRTLFDALEQALGREAADTMMAHLPPVGWADVATKQDLLVLKQDLDALRQDLGALSQGLGALRQDLGALEGRMDQSLGALEGRTHQGLDALEKRMDQRLGAIGERMDQSLGALEERMMLRMEAGFAGLRAAFTEAIATSQARQTRLFTGWNGAMLLAWAGTLIGILEYMG